MTLPGFYLSTKVEDEEEVAEAAESEQSSLDDWEEVRAGGLDTVFLSSYEYVLTIKWPQ